MADHRPPVVRRASRTRSPAGAFLLTALAAVAGVAGFILFVGLVAPPPPDAAAVPGRLTVGDLALELQTSGWITHDDVGGPAPAAVANGFQMPASMMPGLPEHGVHRLYLEAVLSNVGSSSAGFTPREFSVRSTGGATWSLDQPATFQAGSLLPGQARSLDLLFDVPEAIDQLELVWSHDGQIQSVQVSAGAAPAAQHDHA